MKQQGFTLIEVLIVVVIMAMIASATTFSFGRGEAQRFISEGQQIQAWLGQLQTEAILTSNTWGASFENNELTPLVYVRGSWLESADIEAFSVSQNIKITLSEVIINNKLDDIVRKPDIIVLPSGQIMPPSFINLSTDDQSQNIDWSTNQVALVAQ